MLWPLLPLLLLLIARRLPLTQPVYPWCSPPSWSCASIWHLSYMPVSKLQKSLGSRFFWALPQKGIIPRSEKSPSMRHALHLLRTVLIYVSLYFFRLSIKLFLSPHRPATYSLDQKYPSLSFSIFIFLGTWLTASVRLDPELEWLYRFRSPGWLPQVFLRVGLPLGKRRENQWSDIRNGLEVSENGGGLTEGSFSLGHSHFSFLFSVYLKRRFTWEMPLEIKWCSQESTSLQGRDGA